MRTLPVSYSSRRAFTSETAISFLMQQAVENPGVISLAAGLVDPETLPVAEVETAVRRVLAGEVSGRGSLQYGTTAGYFKLRDLVLEHFLRLEGRPATGNGPSADDVVLTTGSQQMLSLVCEVLFDPGDICLVAGPTYFVFAGNLEGVGARAVTIPIDDDGMRTDLLEQALQDLDAQGELRRVKLIYCVSDFDNPAGTSLSAERRRELIAIARRYSRNHRMLILEDAAYRELRYDGEPLPSIWSCDDSRTQVIYAQTFSKTFSPGIRVGFGILPRDLVAPICERKGNEDFGSSNFAQHIVADVLQRGAYDAHLARVRDGYRVKRDAMVRAAREYFSDLPGVSWREPQGGLYVWMSLPKHIETGFQSPLFKAAVDNGVMYVPGELCYSEGTEPHPMHEMRLSFGVQRPEGIDRGMKKLAEAVAKFL